KKRGGQIMAILVKESSMRKQFHLSSLLFVALLVAAGCRSGQTGGSPASNPGGAASSKPTPGGPLGAVASTPSAAGAPTAASAATERLLPATPPPTFSYAGLLFT